VFFEGKHPKIQIKLKKPHRSQAPESQYFEKFTAKKSRDPRKSMGNLIPIR
jgi:hypothetical protein